MIQGSFDKRHFVANRFFNFFYSLSYTNKLNTNKYDTLNNTFGSQ